jgi:hypothetical protein
MAATRTAMILKKDASIRPALSQHIGDLARIRLYATPDMEGLGSLLHQHAQAIGQHAGVFALGTLEEGRQTLAVHHVVGQGAVKMFAGSGGISLCRLVKSR